MRFELHIGVDNAAFEGEDREDEIARILSELAGRIGSDTRLVPEQPIRLRDINGNRVGFAVLTEPVAFTGSGPVPGDSEGPL